MNYEGEEPLVKGDLQGVRFFPGLFKRDYNIADHFTRHFPAAIPGHGLLLHVGKGDYVCGLIFTEELLVQLPYLCVVDKQDAYIPIRQL